MTQPLDSLPRQRTVFDDWRSIGISLYMALVGYGVLVGIPVISTAWVTLLGFSEVEVGRVAGADLGGLSAGAIMVSLVVARFNRRYLAAAGVALAVLANALCTVFVDYEQVLWLRVLAGVGSGIYTAVAVTTLGGTSRPARAFNMLLFAFAFSQALEMHVLPQLSMNGIYTVFIVCYLITLPFLGWIPPRPVPRPALSEPLPERNDELPQRSLSPAVVWLCLAAIFVTYINIGAYWTYIELASLAAGVAEDWIGRILVWASFLSIAGCLFATIVSNRFGLAQPLLLSLVIMAWIVGMLSSGINSSNILVSVFMFNFLWIFIDVYQMATVANVDPSGRFTALMPGAQGLGQIVGPNLAASLLAAGLGYNAVFVMCAVAYLVAMMIYGFMYLRLRRVHPALADAS
ncbi:MAG TPA: MFS transporter [Woeseiaceae bacterium]